MEREEAMSTRVACCAISLTLAVATCGACASSGAMSADRGPARYEGVIRTEWQADGRTMTLLNDVTFIDARGQRWTARRHSSIDGASIPQVLWSAGGPYEGKYRDASVIHDYYCDETPKSRRWTDVHRMFYEAMLVSGVGQARALVMYGAVYRHGPRWPDPGAAADAPPPPPPPAVAVSVDEDVRRLESLVKAGKVQTVKDIEALPSLLPPE
jgi:hypothetical protein